MHAVVIGGGIVGLSSAHALAERGARVTVCERGSIGAGSTERSVGGIRTQFTTPVNVRLSQESLPIWETFEERFGVDIAHRQPGYLFLARDEATATGLRDSVELQTDLGVPSRTLTPDEAAELCPGLHTDQFVCASYASVDGFADPHLALQGYSEAVREAGVEVRTKTAVTAVRHDDTGRVVGVETSGGSIDADVVVNAAGPWARRVARMAGIDLPVAPRRRQIAVVDPETPLPEDVPLTIDLDTGAHFRPERSGRALVGGHFHEEPVPTPERGPDDAEPDGFDRGFDLDWAVEAVERSGGITSSFGPESRIRRGWAGLYAVTPDHHPIIEESIPGFVTAGGFSGHGFQHAPATGIVVAELALDGAASLVDIDPLSSDRFERGDVIEERNVA